MSVMNDFPTIEVKYRREGRYVVDIHYFLFGHLIRGRWILIIF